LLGKAEDIRRFDDGDAIGDGMADWFPLQLKQEQGFRYFCLFSFASHDQLRSF